MQNQSDIRTHASHNDTVHNVMYYSINIYSLDDILNRQQFSTLFAFIDLNDQSFLMILAHMLMLLTTCAARLYRLPKKAAYNLNKIARACENHLIDQMKWPCV